MPRAAALASLSLGVLQDFLHRHPRVLVRAGGETLLQLDHGDTSGCSLRSGRGYLLAHFWSPQRSLVRRITAVEERGSGLELTPWRFGQSRPERLQLLPQDLIAGGSKPDREAFRAEVLAAIQREWPDWRLARLGTPTATAHPIQRLLLRKGRHLLICAAVGPDEPPQTAPETLTQALIWAEAIRRQEPDSILSEIRLIAPPGAQGALQERIACLRPQPRIGLYRLQRGAGQLDAVQDSPPEAEAASRLAQIDANAGNIASQLQFPQPEEFSWPPGGAELLAEIRQYCPAASARLAGAGQCSFRLHGLEVARSLSVEERAGFGAAFGFGWTGTCEPLLESSRTRFHRMLEELARHRHPSGPASSSAFSRYPERWLEELVRQEPQRIEPNCDPGFVYSQVPVCGGSGREIVDLLLARRDGTLCVVELKAGEDPGFPLQALDYWQRVRKHQLADDFARLGYFPGLMLRPDPPQLMLVAPLLRRHTRLQAVLAWVDPAIPITEIVINEQWRSGVRVVERRCRNAGGYLPARVAAG